MMDAIIWLVRNVNFNSVGYAYKVGINTHLAINTKNKIQRMTYKNKLRNLIFILEDLKYLMIFK